MNQEEKKKKSPKIWHPQQEKILKTWGEQSACYRYMHNKAYQKFKKWGLRFTLPIIIISTITGTANFAQETFPESWKAIAPSAIGGLNLFAAILTTVLQFLKVNELLESHRVSSIQFGKLSRIIRLQLTLPVYERSHNGSDFVEFCWNEYDRLIEQSPPVPKGIIKQFENEFPESNVETTSGFFSKKRQFNIFRPEIINITPIVPYEGSDEQKIVNKAANIFKRRLSEPVKPPTHVKFQPPKEELMKEIQSLKTRNIVEENLSKMESAPAAAATTLEEVVVDEIVEEVVDSVERPSVKDLATSFEKSP